MVWKDRSSTFDAELVTESDEYIVESRNIESVNEGDTVVTAFGVEWIVYLVMKRALMTEREVDGKPLFRMFKYWDHPVVKCKIKKGDIS